MPIAHSLKTSGIVLCDKTAHFRVAFYCVMIMLFNQLLDISGGSIILAKEICSLTGI
jgi:hypothetical protein